MVAVECTIPPSFSALCIRVIWILGVIKYIHLFRAKAGDQYVRH